MIDIDRAVTIALGYDPEDVLGMKWLQFHPTRERMARLSEIRDLLALERPVIESPFPISRRHHVVECRRSIVPVTAHLWHGSTVFKVPNDTPLPCGQPASQCPTCMDRSICEYVPRA